MPIRHIRANPCSIPALRGEARLRGLERNYSKTISPRSGRAKPACAGDSRQTFIRTYPSYPCQSVFYSGSSRRSPPARAIPDYFFKDHINAIVHHPSLARGLSLRVRSAFCGETTAGAQRGAAHCLLLSAPLHNRSSEYGIVHSFRIHAVISIVGREEPEERGIWLCPPFRGGLS